MEKTSSLLTGMGRVVVSRKQGVTIAKVADTLSHDRLTSLASAFVIAADIERHSERTQGNKRERLSRLLWLAKQRDWKQVGATELQAFFLYLNHGHKEPGGRWGQGGNRGAKPTTSGTVKTYHAAYRAFFRWCVKEGALSASPMDKIKPPIDRPNQVQPFTSEQTLTLEAAAKKSQDAVRDKATCHCQTFSGE